MRTATAYGKLLLILSAYRSESMNATSAKTFERMDSLAKKNTGTDAESSEGDLESTSFRPFLPLSLFVVSTKPRHPVRRL
jgi:hypothetical protein